MLLAAPDTILSAAVTILAILVMVYTFVLVGRTRSRHNVQAPAMSGHPEVERALRVQGNTLEQVVIFLPLLWLATAYFHVVGWLPAVLGLVWCVGRMVYAQGYMAAAEKRELGFMITALASFGLLVLSIWGVIAAWMVATVV
jgi:glutathione S-transferase